MNKLIDESSGIRNWIRQRPWVKQAVSFSLEPYRLLTSSIRAMPNFIIIGSQKGGTTSLYSYLIQHPCVDRALHKEINFFNENFNKGTIWYRSQFPFPQQDMITGEASPDYMIYPHAPKRIAEMIPSVKLITMLRNPVDRSYSHYYHNLRKGRETLSFEEAINKEEERLQGELEKILKDKNYYSDTYNDYSYLCRGIYIDQLKNWLSVFPKEQMLIIKSEDFYTQPAAILQQVLDFLELPKWELKEYKKYNRSKYQEKIEPGLRRRLIDYYKPYNEKLYEYLKINFDWDR